jgi:hypothetical protein
MPFKSTKGGVAIAVRLRPGAFANRIDGIENSADGHRRLCLRVTAVPEKGKANQAMIKLLAKVWHVPRSSLTVVAGAKERNKTLLLQSNEGNGATDIEMLISWSKGI